MSEIPKIWLTDSAVWIQTADGKRAYERFADYERLRNATATQRKEYTCSPFGIHWPALDEDLSFAGFFAH